jgi:hypothetical protein
VTFVDRPGASGRASDNGARDDQPGDQRSATSLHDDLLVR